MIFKSAHISGFGRFNQQDLHFSEGVNVVYGENGSGKSTLHTFIRCMLFGLERGHGKAAKKDTYTRLTPWDGNGLYGGALSFETDEGTFLIERNFDMKAKFLTIRNDKTGHLLGTEQDVIDQITGGLTEEIYKNTISIEQLKSATDGSLSGHLTNHLSGITFGAANSMNVTAAVDQLGQQKKELRSKLVKDAPTEHATVVKEIQDQEYALSLLKRGAGDLDKRIHVLEEQINEKNEEHEDLVELINNTQTTMSLHTMAGTKDSYNYQLLIQDTYQSYNQALHEQEELGGSFVRGRNLFFGIFFFLLFTALGFATIFYEKLPINVVELPLPKLPFIIGFFVVGILILSFSVFFFVRNGRIYKELEAQIREHEDFLVEELDSHMELDEVTDENMNLFSKSIDEYSELTDTLARAKIKIETVLEKTVELQAKMQILQDEMTECRKEAWEYEQICKNIAKLEEKKEILEEHIERNRQIDEEILAITIAEDTIAAISAKLHESISPALNARVSEIIDAITGGNYERLFVDEDLSITLRCNGRTVPLESLSRGTIEQVYLALRIAAVEILYPDLALPILLDDTFAYYDDIRLQETLKWLSENYPGQVFLFTCHKREAAFLSRMNAPYHLIALKEIVD